MSTPILATKLYVPPPRPDVVPRPRLIERLNEGLRSGRNLTLISAPAGFGKTTLVSSWIYDFGLDAAGGTSLQNPQSKTQNPRVAWLSLDEGDGDLARFLAYLVAALQTVAPDLGAGVLAALEAPQPPPTEALLTALLNEISALPDKALLVLDDYHVLEAPAVDRALAFLLEHLPPQLHLAIATREDPPLPLARYRARGQLTELRANDLRFTPAEAAGFLNEVMGLNLAGEEIAALETRTEGWIAGLQLAALSMQGRADAAGFIKAFAGDHRYIVDYLVEEVLQRQPEAVRSFLLRTAILDRLSGPLVEAVTGQEDGSEMLEALERGNLFVVPLDDRRRWYRYHHLFADVLQAHLRLEQPDRLPTLHRRASEWYERIGSPAEAIRHALAAGDFERAAGLVELAWPAMDRSRRSATFLGWVQALPEELVRSRPVLSVGYAWALLDSGQLEAAEARLRDAERWLDPAAASSERPEAPPAGMVVVDEAEFRYLPASIAAARAYLAQAHGDLPGTLAYARRALDRLPEDDHLRRGIPAALLGLAYLAGGDLEAARRTFAEAMASFRMAGNILFAITGAFVLADIRRAQGRLNEAIRTYEESLQLAAGQSQPVLWGTADLYTGLGELHCEQGDLETADDYLLKSQALGEQAALPRWQYRWCLAQARLKEAEGDLDGALDLLNQAEAHYVRGPVPDVRPIAALKARLWVAQGRLAEALAWARERGLAIDDELSYLGEFEHLTLARLLLAGYRRDREERAIHQAMGLLERLRQAAEAGGRLGSAIEILILQALAYEAQGDISRALPPLERALALAEPEGYVRIFLDEGAPVARLLSEAAARGLAPEYTAKLLAAFEAATKDGGRRMEDERRRTKETNPSSVVGPSSAALSAAEGLIEPLSERELEVLQLVAEGLSNREIAERLFLALPTVKGHNRNIYSKLQVTRRTEAVARARQLGLV